MDRRTHESPMDFEYQNGTGPLDSRSPFAQISANTQRQATNGNGKRGLYSAFGSPSKSTFPSLREPNSSQSFLFSQNGSTSPTRNVPQTPSSFRQNALFSTPRRLDADPASSGGETPKSPDGKNNDTDTDATPDHVGLNFRSAAAKFDQASMPSFGFGRSKSQTEDVDMEPQKPASTATQLKEKEKAPKRRDSWWARATNFVSSPGRDRGEISRSAAYSDKIVKRASRRRQKKALITRKRADSHSDSDADVSNLHHSSPRKVSGRSHGEQSQAGAKDDRPGPHWMYTFFDFLTTHPTLPHILSWYAQLALNVSLFSFVFYILWSFWATIKSDVDKKSSEAMGEIMAEMALCASQWKDNRCQKETRVPAMEVVCNNWEKCMNRDPESVGRARVSAHTFAEIFNGFIEPISYKAMLFTVVLIFGGVALSNIPFSMFRDRANQAQAQQQAAQHHHYYGNVPPTPSRQFSNPNMLDNAPYWTPHHAGQQNALEPAPSGAYGQEGGGSPVRRLQFR